MKEMYLTFVDQKCQSLIPCCNPSAGVSTLLTVTALSTNERPDSGLMEGRNTVNALSRNNPEIAISSSRSSTNFAPY